MEYFRELAVFMHFSEADLDVGYGNVAVHPRVLEYLANADSLLSWL